MSQIITSYKQIDFLKERKREKVILYEELITQDLDKVKLVFSSTMKDSMWGLIPKVAFWGARSLIKLKFFKR